MKKHCNNPQCFLKKTTKQNSQPTQYEKNKIKKDHFGKKKKRRNKFIKKTMQGNIVVIHNVLKKKNYITKFSTISILKQINKDNFKKKIQKQKRIKNQKKKKKTVLG